MIDPDHQLSLSRQSELLDLSRSSLYYKAVPVSEEDLQLMRLIDEIHMKHPYMGSRSIRDQLQDKGHQIGGFSPNCIFMFSRAPRLGVL